MFFKSWKNTVCGVAPINTLWRQLLRGEPKITLERHAFVKPESKIFCIGSCFAVELRKALRRREYQVHPEEESVEIEKYNEPPFLGRGNKLLHYSTYAIRQEFEKAFGLWEQSPDDYWHVCRTPKKQNTPYEVYQDPYRRRVFSKTKEGVQKVTRDFDAIIKKGILESDIYIITLGLTEAWRKKDNGLYACTMAGYGGGGGIEETEFRVTTYEENYANVRAIIEMIRARFPERKIIFSVSPVALGATYTGNDIFVANMESKSTLRTVAGQIVREFKDKGIYYFPSYEIFYYLGMFTNRKIHREDLRHVDEKIIAYIVDRFLESFHV